MPLTLVIFLIVCLGTEVSAAPIDDLRETVVRARVQERMWGSGFGNGSSGFSGRPLAGSSAPGPKVDLHAAIARAARQSGIPAALLASIVMIESDADPCAVSRAGAKGLAQLMDKTAAFYGVEDSFVPAENLSAAARLIRDLLDRFDGQLLPVAAAYNAGPDLLNRPFHYWPAETKSYLEKIVARYPVFTRDRWRRVVPRFIPAASSETCGR